MATERGQSDWRQQVIAPAEGATSLPLPPTSHVVEQPPMSFEPGQPQRGDVIELLPAAARERLLQLRQRAADAHRLVPSFEDVQQASMARIEAENALKRLTAHPQDFGFGLKPDDPRVVAAQKHLDKMTADFERLRQLKEIRTAGWQTASAALAACETWLRDGRPGGTALEAVEIEPPKLAKGENGLLDAIENRRRRVRELHADAHRARSAPYPSSHAKAQMRAEIERLATLGQPDVSALIELDGKIAWPIQNLQSRVYNSEAGATAFAETPDTLALVAWLHRDALIAALDREIATEADDAAALSHEAREKAEAEVMADLLAIERDECSLTWAAQTRGFPIEHRSDCSPLALLGVRLVTTPSAGLPPSSPERAGFNLLGAGRR